MRAMAGTLSARHPAGTGELEDSTWPTSQQPLVNVRWYGAALGFPVGLGGTSWRCDVPVPSAAVSVSEQVEESRIAVIKAWTHPESGQVLCKITSSSDTSSDAAEDAMRIEGIDDAVTWFEQWLTEFQYD